MRRFAAGMIVGAAVVAAMWWATSSTGTVAPAPAPAEVAVVGERADAEEAMAVRRAVRAQRQRRSDVDHAPPPRRPRSDTTAEATPFPPGEAVLHIGDRYIFGEAFVLEPDDPREGDVACLDIRDERATLQCPGGARTANLPLGAVGLPGRPREAAALLRDAGTDFREGRMELRAECTPTEPGFGVVRDERGGAFRVIGVEFVAEGYPLDRRVRIEYVEVPSHADGGSVALALAEPAPNAPTLHQLNDVIAAGSVLPGAHVAGKDFAPTLKGKYERIAELPAELVLRDGRYVVLDRPLATSIEFNGYSGLVAPHGIAATGRVNVRSYTGLSISGDMAGEIETNSYAYVHVAGDVTGKLHVRSYATVVIDGDILGAVIISSYATILVRGRIVGTLTLACGYVDLWLEQRTESWDIPAGPKHGRPATLHLRESNLDVGEHKKVQNWGKVVVGEEAWAKIAR